MSSKPGASADPGTNLSETWAFAWVAQQVQTQAAYLAYIDVFWALTLISAAAIPRALSLRKVKLGGPAPVAH